KVENPEVEVLRYSNLQKHAVLVDALLWEVQLGGGVWMGHFFTVESEIAFQILPDGRGGGGGLWMGHFFTVESEIAFQILPDGSHGFLHPILLMTHIYRLIFSFLPAIQHTKIEVIKKKEILELLVSTTCMH
ncbi:hypothetical protein ACJX0J_006384, partial [Zea mays]